MIVALILAPMMALHLAHLPRQGPFGLDGSYYMQGARYFAENNRLMTTVSLYHEGLTVLPAPWGIYPLWPLLLGMVAKATGLFVATNLLTQMFYGLDLLLFYRLAQRMNAQLGGPVWRIGEDELNPGHLVMLLIGLNYGFFHVTAYPYTEGLAFALGIGSLLLLERVESLPWVAAAGALAGLSYLARYQMVGLPVAAAAALLLLRRFRACAVYCAVTAAVAGPWMVHVHSLLPLHAGIPPWDEWIHHPTIAGNVAQIAEGTAVAFNPFSPASYFRSFGTPVLLVPLALFARPRLKLMVVASGLTGLVATVMLAHYESIRFDRWLFGERHALLFAFTIVAALVHLIASGKPVLRGLAVALAAAGSIQGAVSIATLAPPPARGLGQGDRALVAWLAVHAPRGMLLTTNAHLLSAYIRNPMHWTDCDVAPERTRNMLRLFPIEYVVLYGNERRCAYVRGLDDALAPVARFDDPVASVYLFRVRRDRLHAEDRQHRRAVHPPNLHRLVAIEALVDQLVRPFAAKDEHHVHRPLRAGRA